MIVTRKITRTPSNSKSPGGTHHIEISGRKFSASPEQRGSGWATAEIDSNAAVIEIGATYLVGKRCKKERITDVASVIVTGNESDVVTLSAAYTSSQAFEAEFRGVKRICPDKEES